MDWMDKNNVSGWLLPWTLFLACSLLAGCGGGGGGGGQPASNVNSTVSTLGYSSGGSNHAPVVSNSPATTVTAGTGYSYTPAATDADGDILSFNISNAPSWATFNTRSGNLSGTPTSADVNTSVGVTISVSDGKTTTVIGPFNIAVVSIRNGTAMLNWVAPTTRQDGRPFSLSELSGYNIYEGTTTSNQAPIMTITNPTTTAYTVSNLAPGAHYFSVTAFDSTGAESIHSNVVSKIIN